MSYSIFEETMVDMPWTEVEKAIGSGAAVLLPTGVIEEHGPHMGLGVDTYLGYQACKLTSRELKARGIGTMIAPPCYWGMNNVTGAFAGSFTVRKETMKALLYDIFASLKRWGVKYVFNINWHDDYQQCSTLLEAIGEARVETGIRAYSVISDLLAGRLGLKGKEDYILVYKTFLPEGSRAKVPILDIHAGAGETGAMVEYFPDEVDTELARKLDATKLNPEAFSIWRQGWSDARGITPLGYLGDPAGFNPEEGRLYMEGMCKAAADLIEAVVRSK